MKAPSLAIPCFLVLFGLHTLAQKPAQVRPTPEPALLPAAAQEALNKGIIAAKVPDYLLAIRFFEEARKIAPAAPLVYLNLGLAESKIPGRELRAIVWFGAYLAASPNAANAAAVKEQIDILYIRNQSNTSRFLKTVQDAASQIPGDPGDNQVKMVVLLAKAGDITAALRAADKIISDIRKTHAHREIATVRANAGDIAGAQMAADLMRESNDKSNAQRSIAEAQAKGGDFAGAQKASGFIQDASYDDKNTMQYVIAGAQATVGDIAGALRAADLIQDADKKRWAQMIIITAQAKAGDIAGALKTADLVLGESTNGASKHNAWGTIAAAQANGGDIAGAQKTADLIQKAVDKGTAQRAIAEAQIKTGDIAGAENTLASAQKTADLLDDSEGFYKNIWIPRWITRMKTYITIARNSTRQSTSYTQSPIQPVDTVYKWLRELDNDLKFTDCPLNTEPFLDLAGYLKSLPPSDNPQKVFESLHKTAETIVKAQNVITGMLKQQVRK